MDTATKTEGRAVLWNKGTLVGLKAPLKLKDICEIGLDAAAYGTRHAANERIADLPTNQES
jgi:hypothetical protein